MEYKSIILETKYKLSPEKREYYRLRSQKRRALGQMKEYKSSKEYHREYYLKQRQRVLEHYGESCACCGEYEHGFLSIDHINGGGRQHRKEIHGNLYQWLIKNKFPEGFQTLCHNCNMGKGIYRVCPHSWQHITRD